MITCAVYVDGDRHVENADRKLVRHPEFYGLSTDTKPTTDVLNASVFYEMDTKKIYMFDEENSRWLEQ